MNNILTFNFNENEIRILLKKDLSIDIEYDILFSGSDVAKALGYVKPNNSLLNHVDSIDKILIKKNQVINQIRMNNAGETFINESGLYSLILSSKLESAKEFKRWVTAEVLPQIRLNGLYYTKDLTLKELKTMIKNIALEEMLDLKTDKVKSTIKYLQSYGIKKKEASQMTFDIIRYDLSAEDRVREYFIEQQNIYKEKYKGKIKLSVSELTKLGYTNQGAWLKLSELASKETGIDLNLEKNKLLKANIKKTYIDLIDEYNIEVESLRALNRYIQKEKKRKEKISC